MDREWIRDLARRLSGQPRPSSDLTDPVAVLAVTNFGWHYLRDGSAKGTAAESVFIVSLHPNVPVTPPAAP